MTPDCIIDHPPMPKATTPPKPKPKPAAITEVAEVAEDPAVAADATATR